MNAFFDAFWPNLAATLTGVVLGVPIALWLNSRVLLRQRKFQLDDHRRQVKDAILVLIDACRYNAGVLDAIRQQGESGRVMHSPDLRITTWDAVAPALSGGALTPTTLQMISHHWLRLQKVQKLSDEIFAREVAKSLPPIDDQEVVLEFWRVLCENSFNLSRHAKEGIALLELAIAELEAKKST